MFFDEKIVFVYEKVFFDEKRVFFISSLQIFSSLHIFASARLMLSRRLKGWAAKCNVPGTRAFGTKGERERKKEGDEVIR